MHKALGTSTERAAIVYYSSPTLHNRLRLVNDMLKPLIKEADYEKQWTELQKELKKLIPTRNVLAHHPLKRTGINRDDKAIYIYSIYIEPNQRPTKDKFEGGGKRGELFIEDLRSHAADVDRVTLNLRGFSQSIFKVASNPNAQ